jgi:hypothetical protein
MAAEGVPVAPNNEPIPNDGSTRHVYEDRTWRVGSTINQVEYLNVLAPFAWNSS